MQYPVEVPGVTVTNFLRTAKTAVDGEAPKLRAWTKELSASMKNLRMDPEFASRSVNEGFSGGEKKRHEIIQLQMLKPAFAIPDGTDSGVYVDALRIVSEGLNQPKKHSDHGVLLITHHTQILQYMRPDRVHALVNGRVAESCGPELADRLESEG